MGQEGVRWDRKKLPEPTLHVYGKDNTKIMIYSMRRSPKKGDQKNTRGKRLKNKLLKKELLTLD